ncbi:MAG: hypothetical protein U5J64_04370 [Halobacteriales archaeon]|nr:hypothetical protein [Halobacteriales archaeon]
MEGRRLSCVFWIAVLISVLALGASATPVVAQGTVSIDAPAEVQADGDFDFTVEMDNSSVGEVDVESDGFDVNLSVVDDDEDSLGARTDTSVEFIDIDEANSTYTLNADITDGSEGDTGNITAVTGASIGSSEVDDEATVTFSIQDGENQDDGDGQDTDSGDGQNTDETDEEADNGGQSEGLPGFTLLTALLALFFVSHRANG